MSTQVKNRRKTRRIRTAEGADADATLIDPRTAREHTVSLRDISNMGISFVMTHELAGFELGETFETATVRVEEMSVSGEMVVMHLTPDNRPGSVCGALFYPERGGDLGPLVTRLTDGDGNEAA